jgi:CDP-glycerol glycerophosphotransferase (TagB/SpsB family)
VIAFTWRPSLIDASKEELIKSNYFKMLVKLMNYEKLQSILNEKGYELCIKLHPEMSFIKDYLPFSSKCSLYTDSYNKMYEEMSVMITDYSSSIYDFAYIKKPVVFFQYDKGDFYNNTPFLLSSKFDIKEDGVGPVVNTMQELCIEIEKLLNNGCLMEEQYSKKVDEFFAFHDFNNCERVYQKIKTLL